MLYLSSPPTSYINLGLGPYNCTARLTLTTHRRILEQLRQFSISKATGHELKAIKSEVVGGFTTYNPLGYRTQWGYNNDKIAMGHSSGAETEGGGILGGSVGLPSHDDKQSRPCPLTNSQVIRGMQKDRPQGKSHSTLLKHAVDINADIDACTSSGTWDGSKTASQSCRMKVVAAIVRQGSSWTIASRRSFIVPAKSLFASQL